jgi:hypothetical protein
MRRFDGWGAARVGCGDEAFSGELLRRLIPAFAAANEQVEPGGV